MTGPTELSVIIPTCGRVDWLRRAIESALAGTNVSTEVIVVPNGPSGGWRDVVNSFSDANVRFLPIVPAHACAARNAGLRAACGTFVRFLDDDDYLFPDAARHQLNVLNASGADICSGTIVSVDDSGQRLRTHPQPKTNDLISGVLGSSRATFTHAHLYRREALATTAWAEDLAVGQDVDFLIRVCCARELEWKRINDEVGAWVHHSRVRIYRGKDPGADAIRQQSIMLLRARDELASQGRLFDARREALSDGLWGCFQKGYMHAPRYWSQIAAIAEALSPGRRPPSAIYRIPIIKGLDPRLIETLIIPARAMLTLIRAMIKGLRRAA